MNRAPSESALGWLGVSSHELSTQTGPAHLVELAGRVTRTSVRWHREGVEGFGGLVGAEEAYRKYADDLIRFATALVGPSDAGDVVSGALLSCVSSRAWPSVRDPRAYLFQSVLNEARQVRRSALRRSAREARSEVVRDVQEREVRPEILEAVGCLSVRQRAVVVLTYWDDLGVAAVARRLGISEGSVRRHLAGARARLREVLDE